MILEQDIAGPHEHGQACGRLARATHIAVTGIEARRADLVGTIGPELLLGQIFGNAGRHVDSLKGLRQGHAGAFKTQHLAGHGPLKIGGIFRTQCLHVEGKKWPGSHTGIVLHGAYGGIDAGLRRTEQGGYAFRPEGGIVAGIRIPVIGDIHAFERIDHGLDDGVVAHHPDIGAVDPGIIASRHVGPCRSQFLPAQKAPALPDTKTLLESCCPVALAVQVTQMGFPCLQAGVPVLMVTQIALDGRAIETGERP